MTLEAASWVSQLDPTYPEGGSLFRDIDNHARLIKACLVATWPNLLGAVSLTDAQLNALARAVLTADGTGLTIPAVASRAGKLLAFDGSGNADVSRSFADLDAATSAALAAANFKGNWSSLTGPLSVPASVRHAGRTWQLLNNLADVTLSQPGVTADWLALKPEVIPTSVITTNTAGVIGVKYILAAPGITLTMPTTGWLKGDFGGAVDITLGTTNVVNFGTLKYCGVAVGQVAMDVPLYGICGYYEDATRGLIP